MRRTSGGWRGNWTDESAAYDGQGVHSEGADGHAVGDRPAVLGCEALVRGGPVRGEPVPVLLADEELGKDPGGFVLYYKWLERGRFRIPVDGSVTQLDSVELSMRLSGIEVQTVKRPRLWSPADPASPG